MPDRQRSYDALRRRASFALAPPDRWPDLIADVIAFVDPLITDNTGSLIAWDPETFRWAEAEQTPPRITKPTSSQ